MGRQMALQRLLRRAHAGKGGAVERGLVGRLQERRERGVTLVTVHVTGRDRCPGRPTRGHATPTRQGAFVVPERGKPTHAPGFQNAKFSATGRFDEGLGHRTTLTDGTVEGTGEQPAQGRNGGISRPARDERMQGVPGLRGQQHRGADATVRIGHAPSMAEELWISACVANQASQDGRVGARQAPKGLRPLGRRGLEWLTPVWSVAKEPGSVKERHVESVSGQGVVSEDRYTWAMLIRPLAIALLAASSLVVLPWSPSQPAVAAVPGEQWKLDVRPKGLRLWVDPQDGKGYWYFVYDVVNQTKQSLLWSPKIQLLDGEGRLMRGGNDVPPQVRKAICASMAEEGVEDQFAVMDDLLPGEDNGRTGMVAWLAEGTDGTELTVFIAGASSETEQRVHPKTGEKVTLRENLQLDYAVPGDPKGRRTEPAIIKNREWVMR
ncbi:MAG: hypothetical protein RL527_938 [Planctomycetota bacterium]|jgi:hypothetical protein